jgi:hypothetical protein
MLCVWSWKVALLWKKSSVHSHHPDPNSVPEENEDLDRRGKHGNCR